MSLSRSKKAMNKIPVLSIIAIIALCVIAGFSEAQQNAAISQEAQEVLDRINYYRSLVNLEPVGYNLEQEQGCQNHAEYLKLNPNELYKNAHDENPTLPGYTESGRYCAQNSVIVAGGRYSEVIDNLIEAPLHRYSLIHPFTSEISYGSSGVYHVIGEKYNGNTNDLSRIIVYPANRQKDIPLKWQCTEIPNICPDGVNQTGYPITITVLKDQIIGTAKLRLTTEKNAAVPFYVLENKRLIAIMTKDSLLPNETYFLNAEIKFNDGTEGYKNWSFTTKKVPIANAGPDLLVVTESPIKITGSADYLPEKIYYSWEIISKPEQSNAYLSFWAENDFAEFYSNKDGVYKIRLIVWSSDNIYSEPDYVTIRAIGDKQKIAVETNKNEYKAGDNLEVYVWLGNSGPDVKADAFIGFGMSNGSLWFLDENLQLHPSDPSNSLTFKAYVENVRLTTGYVFPLGGEANADTDENGKLDGYRLFSVSLPQLPAGKYFAFAAFAEAGSVQTGSPKIIGEISIKFFEFK